MNLTNTIGQTETNGSLDSLTSLQTRLRDQQCTGVVQVRFGETRQVFFVYAHGILASSYTRDNGMGRPLPQADLVSLWTGNRAVIQFVPSCEKFGRMAWLAIESDSQQEVEIANEAAWTQQLQEWKKAKFSGLVEIAWKDGIGYLWLQAGEIQSNESVFLGEPASESLPGRPPFHLTTYAPAPESNAWQCFVFRRGAVKWGNSILERFQSVAGTKFAQAICKETASVIQPWGWNIAMDACLIRDEHFFPRVAAATHAYRAIFMSLGSQMGFVIGNMLTQRILTEMFNELDGDERAILSANRLIPAAFSE